MNKGFLSVVLHMHLPFVRHPENECYIEEKWLFEAISESYIPLINTIETLINENMDLKLTLSITPPLLNMLSDKLLCDRYTHYLVRMIELTEKELKRTCHDIAFFNLATMYNKKYRDIYHKYADIYKRDIISVFRNLQNGGKIEIIASAATHGFLPLYEVCPKVIDAQIKIGIESYKKFFNKNPKGIWLPECGYSPSVEKYLKKYGIKYTITESHGLLYANPRPAFGLSQPIVSSKGIVAFGRDMESSRQVWSSKEGYPGDYDYREYYRDIGYDLDYDYIKDYLSPDGNRVHTGIKYYKITGNSDYKEVYNPELALNKANTHASDFLYSRIKQIEALNEHPGLRPIIVCPYDAELFGHWWYEGPVWLKFLYKKITTEQQVVKPVTLYEYITDHPYMQASDPCTSSWGHNGYNEFWLNDSNDWIYRHIHKASDCMVKLADEYPGAEGVVKSALNQAARELLLSQSSDWAFIMKTGTMVQYALKRTKEHLNNFFKIYNDVEEKNINEAWLNKLKNKNNIFPEIDYRVFSNYT